MDVRQRIDDPEETLRAAMDALQAKMHTALPARVISYDAAKQTAQMQVTIKSFVKQEDGSQKAVNIPVLQDVPIQMPGGSAGGITMPVKAGDEMLVVFSSRSPDTWQQSGGDQVPSDANMHNLSNGFAIPGFRSNPNALPSASTDEIQIRSKDGTSSIGLNPATGDINIKSGDVEVKIIKNTSIVLKKAGMLVSVTATRIDLGALGGPAVQTVSGPSSKVFAAL